jgi:hypothetical protein
VNKEQLSQEVLKLLQKHNIEKNEANNILYNQGLAEILDQIMKDVQKDLLEYVKTINQRCISLGGVNWLKTAPHHLETIITAGWEESYKNFMPRNIYDAYARYARDFFFPQGLREGHSRSTRLQDMMVGRSGNAFLDICILYMEHTFQNRRKKE